MCIIFSCKSHLSFLISHFSPLTSHLSPLISHLSSLISHLSSLTSHLSFLISHLSSLISHLSSLISPFSPFPSPQNIFLISTIVLSTTNPCISDESFISFTFRPLVTASMRFILRLIRSSTTPVSSMEI
jgi:hypothetical protein